MMVIAWHKAKSTHVAVSLIQREVGDVCVDSVGLHCYRASGALLPGEWCTATGRAVVRPDCLSGVLCTAAGSNGHIRELYEFF